MGSLLNWPSCLFSLTMFVPISSRFRHMLTLTLRKPASLTSHMPVTCPLVSWFCISLACRLRLLLRFTVLIVTYYIMSFNLFMCTVTVTSVTLLEWALVAFDTCVSSQEFLFDYCISSCLIDHLFILNKDTWICTCVSGLAERTELWCP